MTSTYPLGLPSGPSNAPPVPAAQRRPPPWLGHRTTAQLHADMAAAGGWIDPPPYLVQNCGWLVTVATVTQANG